MGKMTLGAILAALLLQFASCGNSSDGCYDDPNLSLDKPNIYVYDNRYDDMIKKPVDYVYDNREEKSEIKLSLIKNDNQAVDITYPAYDSDFSWTLKSDADGNIVIDNREYNYLYWEDKSDIFNDFEFTEGFCVKAEDTVEFLEDALDKIGLTEKEADDFITYWLPSLIANKYNIITFNPECYRNTYQIKADTDIDNIITAYMVFKKSDTFVDMTFQDLDALNNKSRDGLVIVEWGGTFYDKETH